MTGYIFRNTDDDPELIRLRTLEAAFNEMSIYRLGALGVGAGWRVLEVGFGAGGVARWLAERVGPTGAVVATDIDIRFAGELDGTGAEIRRHDIRTDDLEPGRYDLIHARAVLEYLPEPALVVQRMVGALRPGGWLLVEDSDFSPATVGVLRAYAHPPALAPLVERGMRAIELVFQKVGADAHLGPRLLGLLAGAGLTELSGHAFGGQSAEAAAFTHHTVLALREPMLATGAIAEDDLDRLVEATADPAARLTPLLMVSAFGRRPG
jgi:SAM-dependent methyltransferase